ncbi:hypothetical protein ACQI5H_20320 [Mycobacterium heidelbergense]|uniref:WXG100-like domain-containing protein n=1 Tax=Mycobacterium heidelbergense TaxID=53376 RepID=UPI003CF32A3A
MSIEIPGYLQWVSYLAGSEWPDADEDGMWRIAQHWSNWSSELMALADGVNKVHAKTISVLVGETAAAADEQFKMVLHGEYSVDRLAEAMSAVGELCDKTGTSIEYAKISILASLGKAAVEILYAYATASETWGASLEMIPITEAFTRYSIRQAVMNLLKQIFGQLDHALQKTLVKELLREGIEKLEWAVVKESAAQSIQMANGHRDGVDWSKLAKSAGVGFLGGAVNQGTKDFLKDVLKWTTQRVVTEEGTLAFREVDNPGEGVIKGVLTGYVGGTAASAAGTLVSGGNIDPATVFTSGIASAVKGGVQGGVKANNVERYERGWYPLGKQGSNPFTKSIGWNDSLMTGGLVASSSAAGRAAWVSGHASSGHSDTSSPPPAIPHPTPVAIPIQRVPGDDSFAEADSTTPRTSADGGDGPLSATTSHAASGSLGTSS